MYGKISTTLLIITSNITIGIFCWTSSITCCIFDTYNFSENGCVLTSGTRGKRIPLSWGHYLSSGLKWVGSSPTLFLMTGMDPVPKICITNISHTMDNNQHNIHTMNKPLSQTFRESTSYVSWKTCGNVFKALFSAFHSHLLQNMFVQYVINYLKIKLQLHNVSASESEGIRLLMHMCQKSISTICTLIHTKTKQ